VERRTVVHRVKEHDEKDGPEAYASAWRRLMNQKSLTRSLPAVCMLLLLGLGACQPQDQPQGTADQRYFASPVDAADALVQAAQDNDIEALRDILGAKHQEIYQTTDTADNLEDRQQFAEMAAEDMLFRPLDEHTFELVVGDDQWPLPIPIIQESQGWRFDTAAGLEEIINQRVGQNELLIIDVCSRLIAAQELFRDRDWDGNGYLNYASEIISTPGQYDGLYWPLEGDVLPSPLDEFIESNQDYLSKRETGSPVRGYRADLLTSQGAGAPGGAMDFLQEGRLITGWAMVAWPAEYGLTGIMTFLVSHHGVIYQRDLGPESATIAKSMTSFDPGPEWTEVDPDTELQSQ
jgi:hypothetical protein